MSAQTIKREDSPEPFVMNTPSMSPANSTISNYFGPASVTYEEADVKPLKAMPNCAIPPARFAPIAYYGSPPHDYRLDKQGHAAFVNPGQVVIPSQYPNGYDQGQPMPSQNNGQTPNDFQVRLQGINVVRDEHGSIQPILRQMLNFSQSVDSMQRILGEMANFSHATTQLVHNLNNRMTKAEFERDMALRRTLAHESNITFDVPQTAPALGGHVRFRDAGDMRFGSPVTPTKGHTFVHESFTMEPEQEPQQSFLQSHAKLTGKSKKKSEKTPARKSLQIKLPGGKGKGPATAPMIGLPTPMTKHASDLFPGTMGLPTAPLPTALPTPTFNTKFALTPGIVGPNKVIKRTGTSINKRKMHNLDKIMPPANAYVPTLPLTDTEVIVYFFNSLSRPIVALRLYARNWGPAHIADALNSHREIEGGYLRNTASVKCLTAIKKGKTMYGEDWDQIQRPILESANDLRCTDLMQLSRSEAKTAPDFDIRSLTMSLKKHPEVGVDGGIFTRCVKYCVEHNAPYTLRNVHELAIHINNMTQPTIPLSPTDSDIGGREERRKRERQTRGQIGVNIDLDIPVQQEEQIEEEAQYEDDDLVEEQVEEPVEEAIPEDEQIDEAV